MKPRSAGYFHVGPRKFMSSVAASSLAFAAVSPAPTLAVSPLAVPSLTSARAAAPSYVRRFQYASGVMSHKFPLPLRLARHAPASVAGRVRSPVGVGRPLSLGRAGDCGFGSGFPTGRRRGRRSASADSCSAASACCLGGFDHRALRVTVTEALAPVSPPRGPTPPSTGRAAIKPRRAGYVERWGAESMRHFASSHIQPFAPSPACLVVPVREVSAVPSFPRTRRFAAACASCWRPLRGAPLEASAQVRASRGQASACVGGHGSVVSLGRPLLLGRHARVTRIRRVPSSAHRGRRIASADSCATRVACGGFAFASRIRIAHSALALAHVVPASPVNRSAPTHRSRGRCAMKPRSAPELKRWA
jgi:hypothetical protein